MPGAEDLTTIYGSILDAHLGAFDNKVQQARAAPRQRGDRAAQGGVGRVPPSARSSSPTTSTCATSPASSRASASSPADFYHAADQDDPSVDARERARVQRPRYGAEENKRFNEMLVEVSQEELRRTLTRTSSRHARSPSPPSPPHIGDDARAVPPREGTRRPPQGASTRSWWSTTRRTRSWSSCSSRRPWTTSAASRASSRIRAATPSSSGVGGSGKQSLSRLASSICGYEVNMLAVSSTFADRRPEGVPQDALHAVRRQTRRPARLHAHRRADRRREVPGVRERPPLVGLHPRPLRQGRVRRHLLRPPQRGQGGGRA